MITTFKLTDPRRGEVGRVITDGETVDASALLELILESSTAGGQPSPEGFTADPASPWWILGALSAYADRRGFQLEHDLDFSALEPDEPGGEAAPDERQIVY